MAWTTVDANTSWQELAIAQEIVTAYNKRAAACGVATISASEDMTVFDFIYTVQTGIAYMTSYWTNPDATYTGSTFPHDAFQENELMQFAGLPGDGVYPGWRRLPEGGTLPVGWDVYINWDTFGVIQSKDVAGPWLFVDLQLALSVMTRRVHTTETEAVYSGGAEVPMEPSSPTYTTPMANAQIYIMRQKYLGAPFFQQVHYANCPSVTVTGLSSHTKTIHAVVLITGSEYGGTYYDFGTGWSVSDYNLLSTTSGHTDTTKSVSIFGPITDWSWVDTYVPWSSLGANETVGVGMMVAGLVFWVVDYSFDP